MKRSHPIVIAFAFTVLAFLSVLILPKQASADVVEPQRTKTVILYASDPSDDITSEVNNALSDPTVEEVVVLYESLMDISNNDSASELTPLAAYNIKNVRLSSTWKDGGDILAMAEGVPGTTLTINKTVQVSNSFSCSASVGGSLVSAAVGFDVTGSESISVSGSYTVPYIIGQTPVYKSRLIANPLYNRYSYSVYSGNTYVGSGTADRAVGCSFRVQDLVHEGMG